MAVFLAYLLTILLWPVFALWRGYVICVLWGWFAVPLLGLRQVTIYEAVAAVILIAVVWPWKSPDCEDDRKASDKIAMAIMLPTTAPALFLFVGWVWKTLQWGM